MEKAKNRFGDCDANEGISWPKGELRGLIDLEPQKQLEIQPFAATHLQTYPAVPGNPFRDGSDFKVNGGVDAKIGITNDLNVDLTINPDPLQQKIGSELYKRKIRITNTKKRSPRFKKYLETVLGQKPENTFLLKANYRFIL